MLVLESGLLQLLVLELVLVLELLLLASALVLELVLGELASALVLMVVLASALVLELVLASVPLLVSVGTVPCLHGSLLSLQESVLSLLLAATVYHPPSSMYSALVWASLMVLVVLCRLGRSPMCEDAAWFVIARAIELYVAFVG